MFWLIQIQLDQIYKLKQRRWNVSKFIETINKRVDETDTNEEVQYLPTESDQVDNTVLEKSGSGNWRGSDIVTGNKISKLT